MNPSARYLQEWWRITEIPKNDRHWKAIVATHRFKLCSPLRKMMTSQYDCSKRYFRAKKDINQSIFQFWGHRLSILINTCTFGPWEETANSDVPCHSRCSTIKILPVQGCEFRFGRQINLINIEGLLWAAERVKKTLMQNWQLIL
jgi:hypothetical protein